jgi:hypothetical protein
MRHRIRLSAATLSATVVSSVFVCAQSLPSGTPDLSGDWSHPASTSLSLADPTGRRRGQEGDIPYQPWALAKMMAERPAAGAEGDYANSTDPHLMYCEPLGVSRAYNNPGKVRFVQTPEAVYILHETGPTFRVVWLNSRHPDEPDPQYWGHSIGSYENGDTLVVDTVGFNDRVWLDSQAHPHTEQLHYVERYKRVGDTIEIAITIDDPGAYTRPWSTRRTLRKSETGFMRYPWVCSARDQERHRQLLGKPADQSPPSLK